MWFYALLCAIAVLCINCCALHPVHLHTKSGAAQGPNENREVLVLLVKHIPGAWKCVCEERLEGVSVLQVEVQEAV